MKEKFNILKKGEFFDVPKQKLKDAINHLNDTVMEKIADLDEDHPDDQEEIEHIYCELSELRDKIKIIVDKYRQRNQN